MSGRPAQLTVLAGLLLGAVYVIPAAHFPLAEPDEARYAEVAREMTVTGDLVTPTINFEPFLDKPPLTYWIGAACFALFGQHEFVARLPVLLAAFGGIAITFILAGWMTGRRLAGLTALLLAASPLYLGMGQILTLDMPLTLWTTAAMAALWRAWQTNRPRWIRLAALALAAGVLTKGPIAIVLTAVPAGGYLLLRGRRGDMRRTVDPLALVLLTTLSVPWFIAVDAANPGFLESFLVRHHLERFASPWHHREPFWFFLALLPVATFPWGILALLDRATWRQAMRPRQWSDESWFLTLWAAWPLLLFSASQSKLIPYITPALPPLAILAARALSETWRRLPAQLVRRAGAMLGAVGAIALLVGLLLPGLSAHERATMLQPYVLTSGLVLLVPSWLSGRLRASRAVVALGLGVVLLLIVAASGRGLARDYRAISLAAAELATPDDRIGVYRRYVQGLPFYAKRSVFIVRDDPPWRPDTEDLARAWSGQRRIFLMVDKKSLKRIRSFLDPPPHILARQRHKLLVSNRRS